MVDQLWFSRHWLSYLLWPVLWPLSLLFMRISTRRKKDYLSGNKSRYRAPIPVIVVGNITAGGNGKTPLVIWLVETLQKLGYRPGVVSRGYGGSAPAYPLLVNGQTPAVHSGDEPKLIAQRTGAPVAVSPVRSEAVQMLLPLDIDVVIADDGLQHYALERDIEFIVVDGQRRFGNEKLIPLGPLREPISRCREVDFVINNGGQTQDGEIAMSLSPSLAINLKTQQQLPVSALGDLVAFAGIGHPPRFFNTLEQLGAHLVKTKGFTDHKAYALADILELQHGVDNVIMTEKDAVKCHGFALDNWWYLPVSAIFEATQEQQIVQHIQEVIKAYGSPSA